MDLLHNMKTDQPFYLMPQSGTLLARSLLQEQALAHVRDHPAG